MIYLFHGEDDFLSSEKLARQKNNFISKHGDINLAIYNEENYDLERMVNDIKSAPFLGEKRLVVLENLLGSWKKDDKECFERIIPEIPETTIVIFFEDKKVDKRNLLLKHIDKKNVFENIRLNPSQTQKWILEKTKGHGYTIDQDALGLLSTLAGIDTRHLDNEIKKLLSLRYEDKKITRKDVEELVATPLNTNVFGITDALARKDIKTAQKILKDIISSGENTYGLLSLIANQFRNLLLLKIAGEEKISRDELAKKTGAHPYALQKASEQLGRFTLNKLKEIHSLITRTDIATKTGEMDEGLALDLLILKICETQ